MIFRWPLTMPPCLTMPSISGDHRRFARLSRFEQLDHARQTARDVLGLRRFARDLREHVARRDVLSVLHHHVRVNRHVVLARHTAVLRLDLDRRLLLLVRRVDDDEPRQARDFVDLLVHRDAFEDVLEADLTGFLCEDRERIRIPLDEDLCLLDLLAVLHLEPRAVHDRVALAVAPLRVLDHERPAAVHDDETAVLRLDDLHALEPHRARVPRFERRLLADARRGAADVERPHRELRARLADRLRRDDADRLAELDHLPGRQVSAVAACAHAAARRARQHRADLHLLDAGVLNRRRLVFGDLLVDVDEHLARERVGDPLERDAAHDAVAQRLDDLARFDDRARLDAVERAAIRLVDDHVLRDVDETAREVARVGRLERGVGEALARAVRRDEVVLHLEAFAEVRRDRRLDDLARRLRHQSAHAGELADLLFRSARAGVGHDVDRVEGLAFLVERFHLAEHRVGDFFGRLRPDGDDLVVALAVRDCAFEVLRFDLDHLVARLADERGLLLRDDQVVDADRQPRPGRVGEAQVLEGVEHLDGLLEPELQIAALHELLQALLLQEAVDERHLRRQLPDSESRGRPSC